MGTNTLIAPTGFKRAAILLAVVAIAAVLATAVLASPTRDSAVFAQVVTPTPTPTPVPGICGRTQKVQDSILAVLPTVTACADVTDSNLMGITGKLKISDMGVTSLMSGDFDGLSGLMRLELEDNQISTLPEDIFSGLTGLETLSLTFTKVSSLHEDLFDGLTNLRVLYLYQNELKSLPEDIFDGLTNLESLIINLNKVSALPEDLFDGLSNLTFLNLHRNKITVLPEDVFDDLSNLEFLFLSNNELTALSEDVFGDLAKLQTLLLTNNKLASLSSDVFEGLGVLSNLELTGNQLTELPDGVFEGLDDLEQLGLLINPGAPFKLTAELEERDDGVRVRIVQGTPFHMSVRLAATDGTLSHEVVTIAGGSLESGTVSVTPSGDGDVTVSVGVPAIISVGDPAYSRLVLQGIQGAAGEDLTIPRANLSGGSGNTPATGAPAITGGAQIGKTLTADTSAIADANGLANVTYIYQWISTDEDGDSDIEWATGPSYVLQFSERGKTVKVRVSFIDDSGYYESLASAATAAVVLGGL